MSVLSTRLKAARKARGLTQEQVANMMTLEIGTISGYERDHRKPDAEKLARLAKIYGTSTDYLLGNTNDPRPPSSGPVLPAPDSWKSCPDLGEATLKIKEIAEAHGLSTEETEAMYMEAAWFFRPQWLEEPKKRGRPAVAAHVRPGMDDGGGLRRRKK
ncbi:MAG: helix-turn-helix domain-containing protein [Candidatus Methanomethyliaceae archaeon]